MGVRRAAIRFDTVVMLLAAACGDAEPVRPPDPPLTCPEGMAAIEQGCAWILPSSPCAPGTHARVGSAECHPIGAPACADPFEADGAWSCRERAPQAACAVGQAPFLGDSECLGVGWSPCPDGFVAEGFGCVPLLPGRCTGPSRAGVGSDDCAPVGDCRRPLPVADRTVDANFGPGQLDATHFANIGDAVRASAPGETIVVAAGRYPEALTLTRSVRIVGACTERTHVQGGVVAATAGISVSIENLSISGDAPGIVVARGAQLAAIDVAIEGTRGVGVLLRDAGSAAQLQHVVVRDVRSLPDRSQGRGVIVEGGALLMRDATIVGCRDVGIIAVGSAAEVTLERVVVLDTTVSAAGLGGHALVAASGARIHGTTVVARGSEDVGVLAYLAPSMITLDQAYVARTGLGGSGAGLRGDSGGALRLSRLTVEDATAVGVMVDDASSTASVSAAWITRVVPDGSSAFSAGIGAFIGARSRASGVAIEDANIGVAAIEGAELYVDGSYLAGRPASIGALVNGAVLELVDSTLDRHPAGGAVAEMGADLRLDGVLIFGFDSSGGVDAPTAAVFASSSTLSVARSAIVGGTGFGVIANGATTVAQLRDTLLRGQRSTDGVVGQGIIAEDARLDLDGVRLQDIDGLGLLIQGPARVSRTTVHGVRASRRQNGAALALGGEVIVRDVAVVDSQLAGVVLGAGRIDIDGLLVSGTRPNAQDEFGHAFLGEGTTVNATHIELRGSSAAGLAMDASTARLTRSLLVQNTVGAHAQGGSRLVERVDPPEITPPLEIVFGSDVLLIDNATRVGVGTIPLPDPFSVEH